MRKVIITNEAPKAIGPYSQGVVVGNLVFTSGQLPFDLKTGLIPSSVEEQTHLALKNCFAIIKAAGSTPNQVVKATLFIKNMDDFAKINAIYQAYFPLDSYPARTTVEVARLPKDALIEIEMIGLIIDSNR